MFYLPFLLKLLSLERGAVSMDLRRSLETSNIDTLNYIILDILLNDEVVMARKFVIC